MVSRIDIVLSIVSTYRFGECFFIYILEKERLSK